MDADYYLKPSGGVPRLCLVNGTWDVESDSGKIERVRPQDITTTALLSVEGELDDISGSGQTRAVHDICSGVPRSMQQLRSSGCRALRHLFGSPLAGNGLPR